MMTRYTDDISDRLDNLRQLMLEIASGAPTNSNVTSALLHIEDRIDELIDDIVNAKHLNANIPHSETTRTRAHRNAVDALEEFLPLLGFLLRSTNVRNAFEVYHPIASLAKRLIGRRVRLIISSEWEYSPFLYPARNAVLSHDFVLIGFPASESANGFIFPTAGHELGHFLWHHKNMSAKLGESVTEAILRSVNTQDRARAFASVTPRSRAVPSTTTITTKDLFNSSAGEIAVEWALDQLMEVYCDIVAIIIFGYSYLEAIRYLLAPNLGGWRSGRYPGMKDRVSYMIESIVTLKECFDITHCKKHGTTEEQIDEHELGKEIADFFRVPEYFSAYFENETVRLSPSDHLILQVVDDVVSTFIKRLTLMAFDDVIPVRRDLHSTVSEIRDCRAAFERRVPAEGISDVASILVSAWQCRMDTDFLADSDVSQREKIRILNEMILKSMEIMEFIAKSQGERSAKN